MKRFFFVWTDILVILTCLLVFGVKYSKGNSWMVQNLSPAPPVNAVRLIFIHHSVGENWLCDDNGGLGIALRDNHYYVSDTNYGWGADNIGDRTDIGNWWEWFRGPSSSTYVNALYNEGDQHSSYSRLSTSPSGENEIIMFKSCFPNSAFQGNPSDSVPSIDNNPLRGEGSGSEYHTVANAKGIYIDLLEYFRTHTDKLFIVITAPPLMESDTSASQAANARAFNNWLVNEWLTGYPYKNVAVFDFYNVLTSNGGNTDTNDAGWETGNHHRWWNGAIQHIQTVANNMAAYPTGDSHPSQAGNLKATGEFVSLLNVAYNRWKGGTPPGWTAIPGATPSPPALAWNPVANKLQMVVRAANDSIWTATFNSSGVFNNDWMSIPGGTSSSPGLAWNPSTYKLQMAVRAGNDSIWTATFNSSGVFNNDWAPIPGRTPSSPALAWNSSANELQMIVRASNDSIWAGTFNSNGVFNNDWTSIPGATSSSPALAWNAVANELQIVVRASNDSIWAGTFNSNGVFNNDWICIPGATPTAPALAWDATASELCLVVRGSNDSIWFATFNSSGSFNNDWVNIPGSTPSSPGMAYLPSIGYLGIVVRHSDDSLWEMIY
jgi:hypothetical protein